MSKIKQAFDHGKAFIPFLTCGDPDLQTTAALIIAMEAAGADLIELGIPFSDPTAEGPVIQNANLRALTGGVTTDKILTMVREISPHITVPLVFMTYANVVFSYGTERFVSTAAALGADGLILPDVPFEEKAEFAPVCSQYGLELISMVTPVSEDRIDMIAREAEGFVYCVSSLGVTGMRNKINADIDAMINRVRQATDVPAAIGFGISTPEQAAEMAGKADGIIVGSAIVKLIGQYGRDAVPYVSDYVRAMKQAIS